MDSTIDLITSRLKRKDVHKAILGRTCCYIVSAVILNEESTKVLLIQEAKITCHGKWYLPAGRVEAGESLIDAAKREVKEEAGVDFEPTGITYIEGNSFWLRVTFTGRITGGKLKNEPDSESLRAAWYCPKELPLRDLRSHDILEPIRGSIHTVMAGKVGPLPVLKAVVGASISVLLSAPGNKVLLRDGALPELPVTYNLVVTAESIVTDLLKGQEFDLQQLQLLLLAHDGRTVGPREAKDGVQFVFGYAVAKEHPVEGCEWCEGPAQLQTQLHKSIPLGGLLGTYVQPGSIHRPESAGTSK